MREIELDASGWKTAQDFQLALKTAISAPEWHGDIVGAFLDSIFGGGMNAVKPPYVIKVVNTTNLAPEVRKMVHDFSSAIAETRAHGVARIGEDVAVRLDIEKGNAVARQWGRPQPQRIPTPASSSRPNRSTRKSMNNRTFTDKCRVGG